MSLWMNRCKRIKIIIYYGVNRTNYLENIYWKCTFLSPKELFFALKSKLPYKNEAHAALWLYTSCSAIFSFFFFLFLFVQNSSQSLLFNFSHHSARRKFLDLKSKFDNTATDLFNAYSQWIRSCILFLPVRTRLFVNHVALMYIVLWEKNVEFHFNQIISHDLFPCYFFFFFY